MNKYFLTASLLITITAFCGCFGCSDSKSENTFDGVFTLEAALEGKSSHIGTCFYADGFFYTNAHLILFKELGVYLEAEKAIATDSNNNEYALTIIDYSLDNDIARLKYNESIDSQRDILVGYETTIGEELYTISNLGGYGLAYGYGRVTSGIKTFNNLGTQIDYVQTNIEISSGSSGAPVINNENKIIGIMSMKLTKDGQYLDGASFFVRIIDYWDHG